MFVFCEGENTEPVYLKKYNDVFLRGNRRINCIDVVDNDKTTPKSLIEEAIKRRTKSKGLKEDEYWVVYDRESVKKYSDQYHVEAKQKANSNNIKIAFSSVCFELWLLLHFEYSTAPYTSHDDLKANSNLKANLRKKGISGNFKDSVTCREIVNLLVDTETSYIETAKVNAIRLNETYLMLDQRPNPKFNDEDHYIGPYAFDLEGRSQIEELNPYTDVNRLLEKMSDFTEKN